MPWGGGGGGGSYSGNELKMVHPIPGLTSELEQPGRNFVVASGDE